MESSQTTSVVHLCMCVHACACMHACVCASVNALCVQFQKQNQDTLRLCVDVQWQPLKTTYSFKMSIYSEPSNSSALFVSILGQKCCQLSSVLSVSIWTCLWSTGFINKGSQRVNTAPEWSEVFPATDVCLWYRGCQVILITCRQILQHYTALVLTIILMHCGGYPQDKSDGERPKELELYRKHVFGRLT